MLKLILALTLMAALCSCATMSTQDELQMMHDIGDVIDVVVPMLM